MKLPSEQIYSYERKKKESEHKFVEDDGLPITTPQPLQLHCWKMLHMCFQPEESSLRSITNVDIFSCAAFVCKFTIRSFVDYVCRMHEKLKHANKMAADCARCMKIFGFKYAKEWRRMPSWTCCNYRKKNEINL